MDQFWKKQFKPDPKLLQDFLKLLRHEALVNGNFYYKEGQEAAVSGCVRRLTRK